MVTTDFPSFVAVTTAVWLILVTVPAGPLPDAITTTPGFSVTTTAFFPSPELVTVLPSDNSLAAVTGAETVIGAAAAPAMAFGTVMVMSPILTSAGFDAATPGCTIISTGCTAAGELAAGAPTVTVCVSATLSCTADTP